MDKNTFESSAKYKTLEYITEKVSQIKNKRHKHYLTSFFNDFDIKCKNLKNIKNNNLFNYVKKLMKDDYNRKIISLEWKYDKVLLSYIRNFVYTKLKLLKNDNE